MKKKIPYINDNSTTAVNITYNQKMIYENLQCLWIAPGKIGKVSKNTVPNIVKNVFV